MAFETPITIARTLRAIESREYVLPAIQREFVWRSGQIERLFDSLMRGYPIGSFLFWKIGRETIAQYKFYDFMLEYHERKNPRCKPTGAITRDQVTAVLDGQQRLTALNIGLRGSYAFKLLHKWWNNPDAFPKRHLHLNILDKAEENEAGMQHDFRFLTSQEAERRDETHCWYRVGAILAAEDAVDISDFLVDRGLGNQRGPFRVLDRLHKVVHTKPVIAHYEEDDQDLDKVLEIFVRTNSGGTPLSYSDMLMSMATAQWKIDAREAIHGALDEINSIGRGFGFHRDFLLKAGLVLSGVPSVQFKVTNFNRDNMQLLEERWETVIHAVRVAVQLVARFGFTDQSLSAHNAVLPVAHYLYRRGAPDGFLTQAAYREDRDAIRRWLTRSLLKRGIWGSGLDSLLTALRGVLDTHGTDQFPVAQLEVAMRTRGKSLTLEDEEIKDLAESNDRSFALLSLLYPVMDLQSNRFHIVHVFPTSRFGTRRLRQAGVTEGEIPEFQRRKDCLPNLQLLVEDENESKSDRLPGQWIAETMDADAASAYRDRHDLGEIPDDMTGFSAFYEARRDRLRDKLRRLLGRDQHERESL